jgi:RNA polymerase sigma factor (sigma-70 family)
MARPPLTAAQSDLAERYVPLAKSLAKHLKYAFPDFADDIESAALFGLVEAAQSFEAPRGVKFATFARYRIIGALRDALRELVTAGFRDDVVGAPSVGSLWPGDEENGRVLLSAPVRPVGQAFDSTDFVEWCLDQLPERHRAACREIYLGGKTQGEAAAALGCSKSRLSYLHKESLEIVNDSLAYRERAEGLRLAKSGKFLGKEVS